MGSRRIAYLQFVWLCGLCFNFVFSDPSSSIISSDWDLIEDGWPLEDNIDYRKTQFYYVREKFGKVWKLNTTFLHQFKDDSQIFKLSFKYWSHQESMDPQSVVKQQQVSDKIYKRYFDYFTGHWMPCEYIMSYQDLKSFEIDINTGDSKSIIAFKDIKVEYEVQTETQHSTVSSLKKLNGLSLFDWEEYSPPDKDTGDFLNFSTDCNNGCVLKSEGLNFPNFDNDKVEKVQLSFKYWKKGSAEIKIKNRKSDSALNTLSKWEPINEEIKENKYKEIEINITTAKIKLREDSFVAIKDLKLVISFTNKNKTEVTLNCSKSDCKWKSDRKLQWSQTLDHLEQNTVYYYPKSENNSLEIIVDKDLNENNVCLGIKYWASGDRDVKINVNFNAINDTTKDTILTIKPKVNGFERTHFCLRDLMAFSAKGFVISFNVKRHGFGDGVEGFAMTIEGPTDDINHWNFNNIVQNYLQPMKIPLEGDHGLISGEWSTDWKQLSPDKQGLFEFKEDSIEFRATAESQLPASAQIISQWIKYDPNLHLNYSLYSINVSNPKLFNAFKVRPKVCDWLSHCIDVVQKSQNNTDPNFRVFSFKFSHLNSTQFIKLLFYIEYFQPSYYRETKLEVKFDLKLIHFGDPCYRSFELKTCFNDGICVSDIKNSIPNKPTCSCTQSWTGVHCEMMDFCGILRRDKMSGSKKCRELGYLECESLSDDYRCICNTSDKIIWNKKLLKCDSLEDPISINWKGNNYPTAVQNRLTYKFTNIQAKKYDVCVNLKYSSNQTVLLTVIYNNEKINNNLFSASLLNNNKPIDFCTRDFRYTIDENFDLAIQISNIANNSWSDETFKLLSFKPRLVEFQETPLGFISNSSILEDKWKSMPDYLFTKTNDKLSYNLNVDVSSKTPSKALLFSNWIKNNADFSNSENYYTIQYPKSAKNIFTLRTSILYQENNQMKSIDTNGMFENKKTFQKDYESIENKISIPSDIKSPFKLMFEITYNLPTTEKNSTNLNIIFRNISIGDPCIKYNSKETACKNNGKCVGLGPNNYFCNCFNKTYAGKNCELTDNYCEKKDNSVNITNEEFCKYFPSLPNKAENKCQLLSKNSFECRCPEKDYVWNSNSKRCVRNGYSKKIESCEGKKCVLFDSLLTDSKWSLKNMPKIEDQNKPFYFSSKNGSKLFIQVNNLDNQMDACFKFSYKISGNSSLYLSYNNLDPIAFDPTNQINWYPTDGQTICARSLTKDLYKNFNITLVSKILTIEDDMIALRFDQKGDSLVDFTPRNSSLLSELPYLIHWSNAGQDGNYQFKNQWSIALPENQWIVNNEDSSILFKASGVKGLQTSYLMSNWLRKDVEGYKLRFNISDTTFKNYFIRIIVYDINMQQKQASNVVENNMNRTYIIPINKMSTSFRVAFKVFYKLEEKSEASFILKSIDLGDPCVSDNAIDNMCLNGGKCLRKGPVNNYKCECVNGFTDLNCQTVDYCNYTQDIFGGMKGEEYCQRKAKVNCINGGFGGFSCNCSKDTFWDSNSRECKSLPK